MGADYRGAVQKGVMAAERLHRHLGSRDGIEREGGNVDVFDAILRLKVTLLLRPLDGLLGAYLREPAPGVLVTTQRPLSVQRFTAAHELGHVRLDHRPSLDDENMLRRSPFAPAPGYGLQEVEADAFAVGFLIPHWLIARHAEQQGWRVDDFADPRIVYQLSLRLGASFEATWRTLQRYRLIGTETAHTLGKVKVRDLKEALLGDCSPPDYRRDVWLLTERDSGLSIDGSRRDLFVLKLKEHSGGGYLWDAEELKRSGFAVLRDAREAVDEDGVGNPTFRTRERERDEAGFDEDGIGNPTFRTLTAETGTHRGRVSLKERRPWQPEPPLNRLELDYDLTGPEEEGYSRAERRWMLEAA